MKLFFYIDDNGKRKGPYTLDELKDHYLLENTLVWTEGLEKWTAADRVHLLKDIIYISPPPLDIVDAGQIESVKIGTQVWMKRNLDVIHFRNGDQIPQVRTGEEWKKAGKEGNPAWCFYNNDPEIGQHYGKLYNWFAVNDPRGLAPDGWHVPSDAEWTVLTSYLSNHPAYICYYEPSYIAKALAAKINWINSSGKCSVGNNLATNNATGFSALPGGFYDGSSFDNLGGIGYWWSSTELSSSYAWGRAMFCSYGFVDRSYYGKWGGCSVRCFREYII